MAEPRKEKQKADLSLLIAYRATFSSESGQKVLADLTRRFQERSSMHDNPQRTAFMEGERNVLLTILAALKIDENQITERKANV